MGKGNYLSEPDSNSYVKPLLMKFYLMMMLYEFVCCGFMSVFGVVNELNKN